MAAAATRKRRSTAVSPAVSAVMAADQSDGRGVVVGDSKKRRKVAASTTSRAAAPPPPLSAVARRRLAAEQEQAKEQQLEQEKSASQADQFAAESNADHDFQNSEVLEDSDDQEADEEDEEPIASTSKQPYSGLKVHDKAPKRYFLGGAASLESSAAASPVGDDTEASVIASEGEYIPTGDISRTDSTTHAKRPSRRRRRAENASNFFVDPACASSWRPSEDNHRRSLSQDGSSEQLLGIYPGDTIVIRGCCRLSVIRGAISIDCATLTPSSNPVTLLLPSTHALPVMRAVRSSASKEAQPYHHQEGKASPGLEQPIVISLQNVQSGIESIESVCRLAGMPIPSGGMWQPSNRWSSASEESKDTYKVLLEPERDHCGTVIPHNWIEALESGASSSSSDSGERAYIVQGPKGVGKSTFAKLLVNTLLSQYSTVAYLDCDLGQPEFTPSGFLSLSIIKTPILGPSFTHLNQRPIRMHYLGSTTPKNDPSLYLRAISDLMYHYSTMTDDEGNSLPLVVNTQGWYRGLGADLLLDIHRMTRPSKCFDFAGGVHPSSDASIFAAGASVAVVDPAADTEVIPMQPYIAPENGPPRINASDLRILQFISYFHVTPSSFSSAANSPTWDFSTALLARPPYTVPFSTFRSVRFAVSENVDFSDILRALDVSIVALREEDSSTDNETREVGDATSASVRDSLRQAYERGHLQSSSRCIGLGIIRTIDTATSTMQLLTPVPPAELEKVNAITKGDIEVPTVMMVDYMADAGAEEIGLAGVDWKKVPYLEYGENLNAGVGHGRRRVRRNVMRRSQFR